MDKLVADVQALQARWMTGATTTGVGPRDWQNMDDLSRLAMAGQFSQTATRPFTSLDAALRPDIPDLGLPLLPDALRPMFRRILEGKLAEPTQVARLIAARGHCVNPLDWMPKRSETDLPPIYEPWRDWLDGNLSSNADQGLTAETWEDWAPSHRYQELVRLHRDTPKVVRDLVSEIAPKLPAEQRLRTLQCLAPALSDDDADLLNSFLADRSSKVQAFVKTQLARLGTNLETDAEALCEVTDFVELAKAGLLSRKRVIKPRTLKNDAQRARRSKVFAKISLEGFASVLGLSADDAIETWTFGDGTDDFLSLVSVSGTDAQVVRLTERALEQQINTPEPLMARLDGDARLSFGLSAMTHDDFGLTHTRDWITRPEGNVSWSTIGRMKHLPTLIKHAAEADQTTDGARASDALAFLGLLADRDAASRLLEMLTAAGVMTHDPRLTLLRLNAAL